MQAVSFPFPSPPPFPLSVNAYSFVCVHMIAEKKVFKWEINIKDTF